MRIIPSSGLSDVEIEQMVADSERFREEDQSRKESVEVRNTADSTVYSAEKLLEEHADKVSDDVKSKVQAQIEAVKMALGGSDSQAIQQATAELSGAVQELGASMYGPADAETPPPDDAAPDAGPAPGDEDVIEGEFSEA
jgi:molecular chaperone DnaK